MITANSHRKNLPLYIKINAFVMAVAPVMEAYGLLRSFPLSISFILYILAAIITFFNVGIEFYVVEENSFFLYYLLFVVFMSIQAFITTDYSASLMNSLISVLGSGLSIYYLWQNVDYYVFLKMSYVVAIICIAFAVFQIICMILGIVPPTGEIPGLFRVSSWQKSSWGYRVNSFFSEPQYFALYLLPLYTQSLMANKHLRAILFAIMILLSTSSLGIAGVIVIFVIYMLINISKPKEYILIATCLIALYFVHLYTYKNLPFYTQSFDRSITKAFSILYGDSNSDIRITGYIDYYSRIPDIHVLLGVGLNQLKNYFESIGIYIANYSNTFVYSLMCNGILVFGSMIVTDFLLLLLSLKKNRFLFFLIFILACLFDGWEFSYKYFYILSYIMILDLDEYNYSLQTIKSKYLKF